MPDAHRERDVLFPELAAKERPLLEEVDWVDVSFAMAQIRTQRGLVARLVLLHDREHAFSELDRTMLSTVADLAALALSGR